MNKIRVMIVDDQLLMRDGLNTILSTQQDIEVVALASDGLEALGFAKDIEMDLVLMDIRMPNMDGVTCTQKMMALDKGIKILMLTTFDDDDYIINALSYGASGYLLKDIGGEGLVEAIKNVVNGNLMLPGTIASKIASNIIGLKKDSEKREELTLTFTTREKDIIRLLLQGFSNKELAEALFLTNGTIKNYLTGIYSKVGTSNRSKAIVMLQKLDL